VIYDKPRKGDIRNNYVDPSKAEKTLGFKAKISLKEGIETIVTNLSDGSVRNMSSGLR
jgi:nucleoside-diphosphate-sugar epimerase